MKRRMLRFSREATGDMADAWQRVFVADGEQRADKVFGIMEGFCRSLAEFAEIGTKHDKRMPGLRSTGIPLLKKGSVLFVIGEEQVVVLRVGYLGKDVWSDIPSVEPDAP